MIAIIIESDPVVRIDIEEALTDAFPDMRIGVVDTIPSLDGVDLDFAIADQALQRDVITSCLSAGVIAFYSGTDAPPIDDDLKDRLVIIDRPFSQSMLIKTVTNALKTGRS